MNDYTNPFVVAAAAPAARADFYRKTYMLVAASCAVFGLVLAGTLSMPAVVNPLTQLFFGGGALGWLLVLAAFWGISMLANRLAFGGASEGTQLAGLGIYIVAEALLFAPMLNVLMMQFGDATLSEIVAPAAVSTLLLAGGLTATVFMTKTDFSFLDRHVVHHRDDGLHLRRDSLPDVDGEDAVPPRPARRSRADYLRRRRHAVLVPDHDFRVPPRMTPTGALFASAFPRHSPFPCRPARERFFLSRGFRRFFDVREAGCASGTE